MGKKDAFLFRKWHNEATSAPDSSKKRSSSRRPPVAQFLGLLVSRTVPCKLPLINGVEDAHWSQMPTLPVILMVVRGLGEAVDFGAPVGFKFTWRRGRDMQMRRVRGNIPHSIYQRCENFIPYPGCWPLKSQGCWLCARAHDKTGKHHSDEKDSQEKNDVPLAARPVLFWKE